MRTCHYAAELCLQSRARPLLHEGSSQQYMYGACRGLGQNTLVTLYESLELESLDQFVIGTPAIEWFQLHK